MSVRRTGTTILLAFVLACPSARAATELKSGPDPLAVKREPQEVLAVDQAFTLSAELSEDGFLVAAWRMPDGYYLYRHRFAFSGEDGVLGSPVIPAGEPKTDEFFGDVEVYYGEVTVRVPILDRGDGDIEVAIGYQGCADFGFCYPPEEKRFRFADPAP